jgi:hypothetical protein
VCPCCLLAFVSPTFRHLSHMSQHSRLLCLCNARIRLWIKWPPKPRGLAKRGDHGIGITSPLLTPHIDHSMQHTPDHSSHRPGSHSERKTSARFAIAGEARNVFLFISIAFRVAGRTCCPRGTRALPRCRAQNFFKLLETNKTVYIVILRKKQNV